jgi:hypothetical protein
MSVSQQKLFNYEFVDAYNKNHCIYFQIYFLPTIKNEILAIKQLTMFFKTRGLFSVISH